MSTAYCRQVPAELQESPLYLLMNDGIYPEHIVVYGNKEYTGFTTELYDKLCNEWEDAYRYMDMLDTDPVELTYKNFTEVIMDYFPPEYKERYSTKEIREWRNVLNMLQSCSLAHMDKYYARAMTLVTGHKWYTSSISGCCQCDWQNIIYDSEYWDDEALEEFEAEYFNTGTEWEVHDGEDVPETAEDISGYYLYITDWDEERGLKKALGVDNLVLFTPTEVRTTVYDRKDV